MSSMAPGTNWLQSRAITNGILARNLKRANAYPVASATKVVRTSDSAATMRLFLKKKLKPRVFHTVSKWSNVMGQGSIEFDPAGRNANTIIQ